MRCYVFLYSVKTAKSRAIGQLYMEKWVVRKKSVQTWNCGKLGGNRGSDALSDQDVVTLQFQWCFKTPTEDCFRVAYY